jgi:hypothetical protein
LDWQAGLIRAVDWKDEHISISKDEHTGIQGEVGSRWQVDLNPPFKDLGHAGPGNANLALRWSETPLCKYITSVYMGHRAIEKNP